MRDIKNWTGLEQQQILERVGITNTRGRCTSLWIRQGCKQFQFFVTLVRVWSGKEVRKTRKDRVHFKFPERRRRGDGPPQDPRSADWEPREELCRRTAKESGQCGSMRSSTPRPSFYPDLLRINTKHFSVRLFRLSVSDSFSPPLWLEWVLPRLPSHLIGPPDSAPHSAGSAFSCHSTSHECLFRRNSRLSSSLFQKFSHFSAFKHEC